MTGPSRWTHEAQREQREWPHVTLSDIGGAGLSTYTHRDVTFLNPPAQFLLIGDESTPLVTFSITSTVG